MKDCFLIVSSTSLGYILYDYNNDTFLTSSARGKLCYKDNTSISIGDHVLIDEDLKIYKILERTNKLKRPNVANISLALTVISAKEPLFSSYLLDKYLTINNVYHIDSLIIITKVDMLNEEELNTLKNRMSYYNKIGYDVIYLNCHKKDEEFDKLINFIKDKTVCVIGQTGVGKTSLINLLDPNVQRKTDKKDKIYGRGRHTTKEIKIFKTDFGFIFDTPGFSALDIDFIKPIDVAHHFPGFKKLFSKCKYNDCLHENKNIACEIIKAVDDDYLSLDSYQNYVRILKEVKSFDIWKKKNI